MSFITRPLHDVIDWMKSASKKMVYQLYEGSSLDTAIFSPKFANLCELYRLGLGTPPAFILTTDAALDYHSNQSTVSVGLIKEYTHHVLDLERQNLAADSIDSELTGNWSKLHYDGSEELDIFGIMGAPESYCCPGVMESMVCLGLNDAIVEHLEHVTDRRFALFTYAHFLFRFGCIVFQAPASAYHRVLKEVAKETGRSGPALIEEDLVQIIQAFKEIQMIPEDPWDQLKLTIAQAYETWYDKDACLIREKALLLPTDLSPALCVQAIAFGSLCILFTRCPITGAKGLVGSFWPFSGRMISLETFMEKDPEKAAELAKIAGELEGTFRDMLDVELIIEASGKILVIQARSGRRSSVAMVKIAVNLVHEKILTEREALMKINPYRCSYFFEPQVSTGIVVEDEAKPLVMVEGNTASQGAAVGVLAFSAEECLRLSFNHNVIFVFDCDTQDCKLEDHMACRAAVGVVTIGGSLQSEIARTCRSLAKPCVVEATNMSLHQSTVGKPSSAHKRSHITLKSGEEFSSGEYATIDGTNGRLYFGQPHLTSPTKDVNFMTILQWADKYRTIKVEATIKDSHKFLEEIKLGVHNGADSFGSISTGHLLHYTEDRLNLSRLILFSETEDERERHLTILTELHREDFKQIFNEVNGKPICIKLLDKSLSELVPFDDQHATQIAQMMFKSCAQVRKMKDLMQDENPSFGLRGCRITAVYPHFTVMQIRAIVSSMIDLTESGVCTFFEPVKIAIPFVNSDHELDLVIALIEKTTRQVMNERGLDELIAISDLITIGAVISSTRACQRADAIANKAGFLQINVEDLTSSAFATSKKDAEKFLPLYCKDAVFQSNPFKVIDENGVGQMLQTALKQSMLSHNPDIDCSIAEGEQTCDPRSIKFLVDSGFRSISCEPTYLPMARITVAQAELCSSSATASTSKPLNPKGDKSYGGKMDIDIPELYNEQGNRKYSNVP